MAGPQREAAGRNSDGPATPKTNLTLSAFVLPPPPKNLKKNIKKINSSVDFGMIPALFPVENQWEKSQYVVTGDQSGARLPIIGHFPFRLKFLRETVL